MAQIADITVYDGAATPVSHTLRAIQSQTNPSGVVEAVYREMLSGTPVYANVQATLRLKHLNSGVTRVDAEVAVPVMEAIGSQNAQGYTAAPRVAYVNRIVVTGYFHQRSTVTDRRIAKQIAANLLNNVSTSVVAASSGPVPDLFDSLVPPT